MSKYVKNLVSEHLRGRLENVQEALLVDMIGLDANTNSRLRAVFRDKNIHLMVVKNSLAARATEDTPLAPLFTGLEGTAAICWGAEDLVSLAKEVMKLAKDKEYSPFQARGGMMDGECLDAARVDQISKWPNRGEQLSIISGQILSPGATLVGQLDSVGGALASQIKQKSEEEDAGDVDESAAA